MHALWCIIPTRAVLKRGQKIDKIWGAQSINMLLEGGGGGNLNGLKGVKLNYWGVKAVCIKYGEGGRKGKGSEYRPSFGGCLNQFKWTNGEAKHLNAAMPTVWGKPWSGHGGSDGLWSLSK